MVLRHVAEMGLSCRCVLIENHLAYQLRLALVLLVFIR